MTVPRREGTGIQAGGVTGRGTQEDSAHWPGPQCAEDSAPCSGERAHVLLPAVPTVPVPEALGELALGHSPGTSEGVGPCW